MKYLASLATIVVTAIVTLAPNFVKAQSVTQGYPGGGSSSTTTYYLPSTESNSITNITTPIGGDIYPGTKLSPNSNGIYYSNGVPTTSIPSYQNIYPGTNLFPNPINNYYGGGTYSQGYDRPSVTIQQNDTYPRSFGSNCSTSIVGSPIPSPVPIDRYSGQPCR